MNPRASFLALSLVALPSTPLLAQNNNPPRPAVQSALPLRTVALFSSGVGYFGRAGRVSGDQTVELMIPKTHLNDILKSLVITDPSGDIRPVAYGIEEYAGSRAGNDLTVGAESSLGSILRRFQGARVRVVTPAGDIEGRILSVSLEEQAVPGLKAPDENRLTVEVLNLLTATGLTKVALPQVRSVQLLEPSLDQKLRAALERVATNLTTTLDDTRRPVKLRFVGRGEREVRAGYITETPVWKTSYRLVLDKGQKPFLQGWAIVENTSDEDWTDVKLSLIAGRPVSFTQNLFAPLYISRPEVAPQVVGSPRSTVYSETVTAENMPMPPAPQAAGAPMTPALRNRAAPFMNDGTFAADSSAREGMAASAQQMAKTAASTAAQVQAGERGDLFEYAIRTPVTLGRGEAALVPIAGSQIEGDKVSIFDAADTVDAAVYGFRLKNTTGLHLAGGPITVYSDGLYAGDAQINNVPPGENRLLSYAVDLDVVVAREGTKFDQETMNLIAKAGVLTITRKSRRTQTFTFRNKGDDAKTILVQIPIEPEYTLVSPQPAEKSPREYRFNVPLPAKRTATLSILSERPISQAVALVNADLDTLVAYTRGGGVSPALRAALEQIITKRRRINDTVGRRAALEAELKQISEEQSRIRANMNTVGRETALYAQYLKKLTEQEERIDKVTAEIERLRAAEIEARNELRSYLDNLSVE